MDNARIDQRALATDKASSERALLVSNPDGSFAIRDSKIMRVFFLPKGDSWEIASGGNLFQISNDHATLRTTIGVDKTAAIAHAQRDVHHASEEAKAAQTAEAKLEEQHTQRQRDWNRAKRALQQNDDRIGDLASLIDNLNAEVQASMTETFDPSEYEDDVAQAEAKVEQIQAKDTRLRDEIENRKPEVEELKGQLNEVTQRNLKVTADIEAVQVRLFQPVVRPPFAQSFFWYQPGSNTF